LLKKPLRILEKFDDEFHEVHDLEGNDLIVYSSNNNLYVPRCSSIDTIEVVNQTDKCFHDYPVYIKTNVSSSLVFLTRTGILKKNSKLVKCNNNIIEINIHDIYFLTMQNGKTTVKILTETDFFTLKVRKNDWINYNYQHDNRLSEDVILRDNNSKLNTVNGHQFEAFNSLNVGEEPKQFMDMNFNNSSDMNYFKLL